MSGYAFTFTDESSSRWQVIDATGNFTTLPDFLLPENILTPEPALSMGRAVNSSIQTPSGDGKPRAGFLVPTSGLIRAGNPIALYQTLLDYESALAIATLLRLTTADGELEWDLWPAASYLSSARKSGQASDAYLVDGYFGVKQLKPRAALYLGYRVTTSGQPRVDSNGNLRVVVKRFGG